jgi:hypothetical protein
MSALAGRILVRAADVLDHVDFSLPASEPASPELA